MPPTTIADPVITVRALIEDNWVAGNLTANLTPTVTAGWYNRDRDIAQFLVTVTPNPELEASAYLGSAGPGARWEGTLDLNIWASPKVFTTGNQQALARKLVYEARQEVDRIIRVKQTSVSGYTTLRIVSRRPLPEVGENPTVFRWLCEVEYGWIELAA